MSNTPHSPNQKRFSRQGFQPLPNSNMAPNDATIDIPLEEVPTRSGGLRGQSSLSPLRPTPTHHVSFTGQIPQEKRTVFGGHRVKKINSKGQPTGHKGYDGEEDTINTMGKIYYKILNFSIITRYFLYVLPLALVIGVPIVVGATVAQNAKIGGVRIVWFFAWVEIIWLSIWVSKIVAHFLPPIFEILAGVVSSGVRKYSMVLRALEIPLSLVGWALTSLATFIPVMTRNPTQRAGGKDVIQGTQHWETIVNQILAAALVATLIYLGEKTFIQLISINYHRKQFNSRIKDSKHNVYLLSLLYDASRNLFPAYCNEFAEEDYIISDQLNISLGLSSHGSKSHQRSGSATPMRIIQDVGRFGDKITSAFGNVAHEITGKQVFNPNSSHSIVVEALEKPRTSEALAKRIWMSFVVEGKEALYQEDILDVMGEGRAEEAAQAFASLDQDGNGDISLDEMILTITEFGRERKSIANSMHDVDQAINVLDRLLCIVVFGAVVLVFVAFLNASFVTTLATTGTALLSLSFVFSVTCQEVLGSCIFLFVKHPYDIGDRVDIGATDQFTVDHISLLFTVFRRVSGTNVGRMVQIPNIVLNTLWIENVSRSKAMKEQLSIYIDFGTTFEDLQLLKNELLTFVSDRDNSRDFQPDLEVEVLGTSDMSKLELKVEIKHKSNWANESVRAARRSKFMCALVAALRRVPINPPGGAGAPLGDPSNPSYSVAIADEIANKNKEAAAAAKDASRLVPTKKIEDTSPAISTGSDWGKGDVPGLSSRENKAVGDLNSRDAAVDAARDEIWTSSRDDNSTLGERPSIDRQDLDDVRGLLRRESTKGKRKPGETRAMVAPSVPTIQEPPSGPPGAYNDYAQTQNLQQDTSYENTRPAYSTAPAPYNQQSSPYRPQLQTQTPYQSAMQTQPAQSPIEMRQVTRSPSNPYRQQQPQQFPARSESMAASRKRSESVTRKPLSPTASNAEMREQGFGGQSAYEGA